MTKNLSLISFGTSEKTASIEFYPIDQAIIIIVQSHNDSQGWTVFMGNKISNLKVFHFIHEVFFLLEITLISESFASK